MPISPGDTGRRTIQSVDRTFRIIGFIQTNRGATLPALASAFDLSKSTIHYHLNTLMKHGYVVREGDTYQIGLRILDPAIHAKNRKQGYQIIQPKVKYLAEETGERAQFIAEENGLGIHVHSEIGENGVQSEARVGETVYLHTTSAGKVILASLPEKRVNEIVDIYGLPKLTEHTITDRNELFDALEEIRERGYGFNRAERRDGMMAIGVDISNSTKGVVGAISVTGPIRRMEGKHREYLPDLLLEVAEEIQLRFEFPQR